MALQFNEDEIAAIAIAQASDDPWEHDGIKDIKTKIKDSFMLDDSSQCCYCARSFRGEFKYVIDIEHVLPQSKFDTERFVLQNLNVSCKRCNMKIKNQDISFLVDRAAMAVDYYQSAHYKFIHPNLDTYNDHISLTQLQFEGIRFTKYIQKNDHKASYTYKYFRLQEFEVNDFNNAQGATKTVQELADIPANLLPSLLDLVSKL